MTRFFRTYSVLSLVVLTAAATAMFIHHRAVLVSSVSAIAETSSVTTARMVLHPIRTQLASYVESANWAGADPSAVKMPESLQASIIELIRDSRVARVKVYNHDGIVIFSTRQDQIGGEQEDNPGFATAMAGRVSVQLVYRDTFNTFDKATEDANLVQTYFPVRALPTTPVVGVFEIYTDVNSLVVEAERSELVMLVGTALTIAVIYGALLLLVYKAHGQVEEQQRTIAQKNALLEQLSRESMRREESERKRFAAELHEGLAQSLSAVKLALENVRGDARAKPGDTLASVIPDLQSAIGQARAIAVGLHPLSLEELGLGSAVREHCNRFSIEHPTVHVEHEVDVDESGIPAPLKVTVFRVLETALAVIGAHPEATRVRVALQSSSRALTLLLEDDAMVLVNAIHDESGSLDPHSPFGEVRERVMVSRGSLSVANGGAGAPALRATWLL